VGRLRSAAEVLDEIERDRPFHEVSRGGATFSGGEPLLQPEFLLAMLRGCGERGIHRVVDTCGFADRADVARVAEETDLFLFDLKTVDPELHRSGTGRSNEAILDNLAFLAERSAPLEIRYPVVPGVSDRAGSVDRAGAHLSTLPGSLPVRVLPFHAAAEGKHARFGIPWQGGDAYAEMSADEIRERLRTFGLEVVDGETGA
jgi:pyruvate formate lyase activating enzyme